MVDKSILVSLPTGTCYKFALLYVKKDIVGKNLTMWVEFISWIQEKDKIYNSEKPILSSFAASKEFIEARKRALKRFLMLVVRHPVLCEDKIVNFFLTVKGSVGHLLAFAVNLSEVGVGGVGCSGVWQEVKYQNK